MYQLWLILSFQIEARMHARVSNVKARLRVGYRRECAIFEFKVESVIKEGLRVLLIKEN